MVIELLIIIGIILAILLFKKVISLNSHEYPKKMLVSDDETIWNEKEVILDMGENELFRYLTRNKDEQYPFIFVGYKYAKEIDQLPPVADK